MIQKSEFLETTPERKTEKRTSLSYSQELISENIKIEPPNRRYFATKKLR
uniref:Uncharacterized protein n=1 Tax=Rhizophagus irregularis (strain DAOM 181602 / DAOM 197198 / MUCL 43194) TaxID=747089 RepID=U9TDQ3_RHIID